MAPIYLRGGIPRHVNGTTANPATVEVWTWEGMPANFLWFQNTGAGVVVLSFTKEDADAGIGISIAAGADYSMPTEIDRFWTKSAAAQTFQAVAFMRRG